MRFRTDAQPFRVRLRIGEDIGGVLLQLMFCPRCTVALETPPTSSRSSRASVTIAVNHGRDQRFVLITRLAPSGSKRLRAVIFLFGRGALKIFAAGNLEGRKGVAIALQGLAQAKKKGVQFSYRIPSRGPEFEHLQHLAKRLGIGEEVDLGRQMPREDYIRELQDTDLYLLPGLREGGGLTMMEAMLAGCVPIIATCGGPGTAVTDECGVRVPVTSPKKWQRKLQTLWSASIATGNSWRAWPRSRASGLPTLTQRKDSSAQ